MELTMIALFMLVFGKAYATKSVEELKKVNASPIKKLVHATTAIVAGLFDQLNLGDHVDANVSQSVVSKSATDYLNACSESVRSDISRASATSDNGKVYALRAATVAMLEAIFVGGDNAKARAKAAYQALVACGFKPIANRMLAVLSSTVETEKDKTTYTMTTTDVALFTQSYEETAEYYATRIDALLCHDIAYTKNDEGKLSGLTEISARDTSVKGLPLMWEKSNLKGVKNTAKKASKATSIADLTAENSGDVIKALVALAKTDEATKNALIAEAMKLMYNV